MASRIVVLSNLDGTRFDPYFDVSGAAAKMFLPLARERVPIVFFSSRTRAELELIQQELGIQHPFVAENGGALFVPRGYFGFDVPRARPMAGYESVAFGRPYGDVVGALRSTAEGLGVPVTGFHDMSVRDVAVDCGLSLRQARLAKDREFSEPFRIASPAGASTERLMSALRRQGLRCLDTGRYMLTGAEVDAGAIADLLLSLYERAFGPTVTVGIGDPVADLALLRRVDVPFIGATGAVLKGAFPAFPRAAIGPARARTAALLEIVESLHARSRAWPDLRH